MSRSPDVTVCVRPSALLTPALFLLLTDTPILLAALLPALRKLTEGYAALGAAAKKTLAGLIPELAALIEAAEDALR